MISKDGADAQQSVRSDSNYYALVYLALATLTYVSEGDPANIARDLQDGIKQLKQLPKVGGGGTVDGKWNLIWGPVISDYNSNMMYAIEYADAAAEWPIFAAVAIRGTDTKAVRKGLYKQIYEDINAGHLVYFDSDQKKIGKIAKGTGTGLDILLNMTDNNSKTVQEVLKDRYYNDHYHDTPVVVTGHSLGGCMTTVMSYKLALNLDLTIVPQAFAPPTAGNKKFAESFGNQFKVFYLWMNNMDIVPNAFWNMAKLTELWPGIDAPKKIKKIINKFKKFTDKKGYTQPGKQWLQGSVFEQYKNWADQVSPQHSPWTYADLIRAQYKEVAPYELVPASPPPPPPALVPASSKVKKKPVKKKPAKKKPAKKKQTKKQR